MEPHFTNALRIDRRLVQVTNLKQFAVAFLICFAVGVLWLQVKHPLVGPVIALLPIAGLIVLKMPFPFALGFVVFSFFRLHEVFPQLYSLHIPQLLALGTLVSLAWSLWTRRLNAYWTRELSIFFLFFCIVSLGVFFASNRAEAMASYTGNYVKIAVMVVAIAWLAVGIKVLRLSSWVIIFSGVLVGGVAIMNKMKGIGLVEGTRVTIGRDIGSMLGDPNDLALVLLFPAGFALSYVLNRGVSWPQRVMAGLAFLILISAVVATQSRGGLLGIAAVMGVFAYRRVKSKALLALVAFIALSVLFTLAGVSDRASGGAHEEGIDESAMGRIYAWGAALKMAVHNPLTGVGLNNFLLNYWIYSDHWDGQNHAVHSTWFGVLAEAGFLGLLVFIAMIALIYRCIFRSLYRLEITGLLRDLPARPGAYTIAEGILASMVGITVSATFLTMGFTWPIYILLSLATALGKYTSELEADALQIASHIKK